MADIFADKDARNLLQDKFVFMLGDSNMRATYKDLVLLINKNQILDIPGLRRRGEESFEGDKRISYAGLTKGRQYVEGREFLKHGVHLEYHFITRCYTQDVEQFFKKMKDGVMKVPDVIIMNSCIWDITRWGPTGVETYKDNMKKLMNLLRDCLTEKTLFIWTTTLPVSTVLRGGLIVKQIDFLQNMLRFEVMEANLFCRHLVVAHGYDVLDTHYHLRMQIHRRLKDGLHFGPLPVRFISNLLLTHIALSWDEPLPGNFLGIALERIIECGWRAEPSQNVELPVIPKALDRNNDQQKSPSTRGKVNRNRPVMKAKRQLNNFNKRGGHHNYNNNNNNNKVKSRKQVPVWQDDQWTPITEARSNEFWKFGIPSQRYANPAPAWNGYNDNYNQNNYDNYNQNDYDNYNQNDYDNYNQNDHDNYNQNNYDNYSPNNYRNNYESYSQNDFADFDRAGGPMRKNPKYQKKRPTPY